jgi:ubiquinone/menaquinone biosynthesis C-methylase UbiE
MLSKRMTLSYEAQARLDAVSGMKGFLLQETGPRLARAYAKLEDQHAADNGGARPQTRQEVQALAEQLPLYWFDRSLARTSQQMMWRGIGEALDGERGALEDYVSSSPANARGGVEVSHEFQLPDYYTAYDIHVMPGSFYGDPLAGLMYDIGAKLYAMGYTHAGYDSGKKPVADAVPDLEPTRILDLGCGIGGSTMPLADRFPGAEIYGIDLAEPMLRAAHHLFEENGKRAVFVQGDAAETGFADGFFDVVTATILFHEVPVELGRQIVREAYRIVRPGGWFVVGDVEPYRHLTPYRAFMSDWQTNNNGEPFWRGFLESDLTEWFRDAGFNSVETWGTPVPGSPRRNPWITRGQK